jgi:hypothetical protein
LEPEANDFCALIPGRSLYKALLYSLLAAADRAFSSFELLPEDLLELGFGIPEDDAGMDDEEEDVGIVEDVDVAVFEDLPEEDEEDCVLGIPVRLPILEDFFDDDGVGLTVASLGSIWRGSVWRGSVCLGSVWRGSV